MSTLLKSKVRVGLIVGDLAAIKISPSYENDIEIFSWLRSNITSLAQEICDINLAKRYLKLGSNPTPLNVTLDDIITALCSTSEETFPQMALYLNLEKIGSFLQAAHDLQPDVLAQSSNMTSQELSDVARAIEDMIKIYPEILTLLFSLSKEVNTTEIKQKMNVSEISEELFPYVANNLLCGEPLRPITLSTYKPLQPGMTNGTWQPVKPRSCKIIEKTLKSFSKGYIIWEIMESILNGEITFTPTNNVTRSIIENAAQFFTPIDTFKDKVQTFADQYGDLKHISYYESQSRAMTDLFFSSFFVDWTKSRISETYNTSFLVNVNVTEISIFTDSNIEYLELIDEVSSALDCVNTNRFRAVSSENKLIEEARKKNIPFLAGIVFINETENYNSAIASKHVQYKIRMEVDSVPQTGSIKEKLWVPGPDGDFYYNMRYFWGFIQIQDLLDNAIIKLQTGHHSLDRVFMQQFPYPCFMRNNFLSGLYTIKLLPIALVFSSAVVVCLFVNEFIKEKESGNTQLLKIEGLSHTVIWASNFIIMAIVLIINSSLSTVIMHWGNLIPLSEPLVILMVLLAYNFSLMMFIFLMTTLLNRASSGSVVTLLLCILTLLPFLVMMTIDRDLGGAVIFLSNIFMSTAFGSSISYITRYEQKQMGLDWTDLQRSPIENDDFNLLFSFMFMICDGILYGVIGLIIVKSSGMTIANLLSHNKETIKTRDFKQNAPTDSKMDGIYLKNIRKLYKTGRNKSHVALDNLTIHFKKNEITGLLGHNGAGKTTTMGIIAGMLLPTSGSITMKGTRIGNKGTQQSSDHHIGYCPQQGILYENMSVYEHLYFHASIGMDNKSAIQEYVEDLMIKMNLQEKEKTLARHLSEGLRRCLAIGMAFAGNASFVVLDEPTSGVDSVARRRIWDFILKCKLNRTIILSTHLMDEAEILCDRIAILHTGFMVSHGTPSQLLEKYADCVHLSITKDSNPEFNLTENEHNLIRAADLDQKIRDVAPNCSIITQSTFKVIYSLPLKLEEDIGKYSSLFDILEREKENSHILSYSVSLPTLEDIFATVTWGSTDIVSGSPKANSSWPSGLHTSQFSKEENTLEIPRSDFVDSGCQALKKARKPNATIIFKIYGLILKRFWNLIGDKWPMVSSFAISFLLMIIAMSIALIRPDSKTPAVLLTPSLYGPGSLSFISTKRMTPVLASLLAPPGIGTTCLLPANFISPHTECVQEISEIQLQKFDQQCQCSDYHWTCIKNQTKKQEIQVQHTNTTDTIYFLPTKVEPNSWILETHYDFIEKLFGGWKFHRSDHFVYFNNKGFHSPAAYLNAINNARLRSLKVWPSSSEDTSLGISTYNHPFRRTDNQVKGQSLLQHINDYTLALLMVALISFVPCRTILYLVTERTSDEKQIQRSFSIGIFEYWTAALLWSILISFLFVGFAAIIIKAFGVKAMSLGSNFLATLLLIFCYSICMNCLIFLTEKIFQDPSLGQIISLTTAVFTGISTLVLMLLLFFFWWIKPIVEARKLLNILFLLLPPFAAGKI